MVKIMDFFRISNKPKTCPLIDYIYKYARTMKYSDSYKSRYRLLAKRLDIFQEEYRYSLFSDSLTMSVCDEFVYFLKKLNLRHNTIRSIFAQLKVVTSRLKRDGFLVNSDVYDICLKEEEVDTVYLSSSEIDRLLSLKLNKENKIIRDVFVIGCYTGLRYSDLSRLDKDNFIGDVLRMRTRKTGWFVEIPLHPIVKRILEGYNYSLPRQTSPQNFNARIKNICKRAEINVPVVVEYTKGFKVHRRKFLKYELISSHTARRSLATNMYLAGVSTFRIMLITGHRTESSFFRYIRISRSQNAKELSMHAFFKMESINLQKKYDDSGSN